MTLQVTGEPPDILTFEMESLSEDTSAQKKRGGKETEVYMSSESAIGTLNVQPVLNPQKTRSNQPGSVSNCFKAVYGQLPQWKLLIVVGLPFSVPDNICHYAIQEITMGFDQQIPNDVISLILNMKN